MGEKIIYEYCLLRYVADIEREEFVNVGLMMMSKRNRWMRTDVCLDNAKIEGFFRISDVAGLRRQLSLFMREDVPGRDLPVEERYRWLAAVKSACIQTSASHPGVIPVEGMLTREGARKVLEEKFDELFRRLVE
ncbi:MAG: DUF3037 domain-containing protein [Muribaculaceae bacterium]|nr:DUF3037 domain-containing protein [Muribaculaceae bacterium]